MHKMHWGMRRPPGFPFVPFLFPFLFPLGLMLTLSSLMVWLQYRSYRALQAIEQGGKTPGGSPTR